jgi:hypothetical protein
MPQRALEFPVQDALETSPVEQAGETVSNGLLLDPVVGPGMMDGNGRKGAENVKRLEKGSGKFSQGKVIDVKNADDLMRVDEGDTNEGLDALMNRDRIGKKRFVRPVVDNGDSPGL